MHLAFLSLMGICIFTLAMAQILDLLLHQGRERLNLNKEELLDRAVRDLRRLTQSKQIHFASSLQ